MRFAFLNARSFAAVLITYQNFIPICVAISIAPVNVWNGADALACLLYLQQFTVAGKSLLFQEICFYGELFHCYWWQWLMILTALELSPLHPQFYQALQ